MPNNHTVVKTPQEQCQAVPVNQFCLPISGQCPDIPHLAKNGAVLNKRTSVKGKYKMKTHHFLATIESAEMITRRKLLKPPSS